MAGEPSSASVNAAADRAEELFQQARHEIYRSTDQLFGKLMLLQWIAGVLIAVAVSPLSWAGQSSRVHIHVWAAIFVGGAISIFPVWLTRVWPTRAMTRHVIAV